MSCMVAIIPPDEDGGWIVADRALLGNFRSLFFFPLSMTLGCHMEDCRARAGKMVIPKIHAEPL